MRNFKEYTYAVKIKASAMWNALPPQHLGRPAARAPCEPQLKLKCIVFRFRVWGLRVLEFRAFEFALSQLGHARRG